MAKVISQTTRMTTGQAAAYIGVSPQAIRDWIAACEFPTAYKIGDRWALAPEEVQRRYDYFHSTEFDDESEEVE